MKTQKKPAYRIEIAHAGHVQFAEAICHEMAESAKVRKTGIAKRSPEYVAEKMREGKAVVAIAPNGGWAGFCYIESWEHGRYVANSGLIVSPEHRQHGLARGIKKKIFELSRSKFPDAKIFGLTTGLAVMKINSELGYEPVTYSELTQDEAFWQGCKNCVNYEILMSKDRKNCLCTAMLFNPELQPQKKNTNDFLKRPGVYARLMRLKEFVFNRRQEKKQRITLS